MAALPVNAGVKCRVSRFSEPTPFASPQIGTSVRHSHAEVAANENSTTGSSVTRRHRHVGHCQRDRRHGRAGAPAVATGRLSHRCRCIVRSLGAARIPSRQNHHQPDETRRHHHYRSVRRVPGDAKPDSCHHGAKRTVPRQCRATAGGTCGCSSSSRCYNRQAVKG